MKPSSFRSRAFGDPRGDSWSSLMISRAKGSYEEKTRNSTIISKPNPIKFQSLKKEVALLFLALFYFLIATNTQTGWLFVLSAFMMGLLILSLILSRTTIGRLAVKRDWLTPPSAGKSFRVRTNLENLGKSLALEARLEIPSASWTDAEDDLQWAIPKLAPGATASTEYSLTPRKRGEHQLPPATLICGAPFGLFTVCRRFEESESFLVYPEIQKLPTVASRSRLAVALGEVVSSTGLGDSRSLRSVRDYHSGDDLRNVHWKASAKRGPNLPLLVREHHSPAPEQSVVVLDTSNGGLESAEHPLFERAVTLAASVLWSAHRNGKKAFLVCLTGDDQQTGVYRSWTEQFDMLARITLNPSLDFNDWCTKIEQSEDRNLSKAIQSGQITLVKACFNETRVSNWPSWTRAVFLFQQDQLDDSLPPHQNLIILDSESEYFRELPTSV